MVFVISRRKQVYILLFYFFYYTFYAVFDKPSMHLFYDVITSCCKFKREGYLLFLKNDLGFEDTLTFQIIFLRINKKYCTQKFENNLNIIIMKS